MKIGDKKDTSGFLKTEGTSVKDDKEDLTSKVCKSRLLARRREVIGSGHERRDISTSQLILEGAAAALVVALWYNCTRG